MKYIILCEVLRVVKFTETGSGMMVARASVEEKGELVFNGCRVSVLQDDEVLVMDGGDGCTTA